LASLRGERIRYSPATKSLVAQTVTIETPTLQVVREKDGLHAAGFVFKLPEPKPAEQIADPANSAAPDPNVKAAGPQAHSPPVKADEAQRAVDAAVPVQVDRARIDSLVLQGIDLYLADRVGNPATVLPITELDGEVRGLSTRTLQEKEKLNFTLLVGSGRWSCPRSAAPAACSARSAGPPT
jgi:hypothetical protein